MRAPSKASCPRGVRTGRERLRAMYCLNLELCITRMNQCPERDLSEESSKLILFHSNDVTLTRDGP